MDTVSEMMAGLQSLIEKHGPRLMRQGTMTSARRDYARRTYSTEDRARVRRLWNAGKSMVQISNEAVMPYASVRMMLMEMGVRQTNRRCTPLTDEQKATMARVFVEMGCKPGAVPAIAEQLGVTSRSVYVHLALMGLRHPKKLTPNR